jgi:hypothetical protein
MGPPGRCADARRNVHGRSRIEDSRVDITPDSSVLLTANESRSGSSGSGVRDAFWYINTIGDLFVQSFALTSVQIAIEGCVTSHARTGAIVKRGNICSFVLVGLFIWTLYPSAAESSTPESDASCLPQPVLSSATGARAAVIRYGVSTTPKPETSEIEQGGLSILNLRGIRYAKGQGVKKNPAMAMRLFLRSAMQGYTPAMANLGTLYETGAVGHRNFQRAYAWMRTALSFGVPEDDHDAAVLKLGMIAARLDTNDIDRAERLARAIATRIVDTCQCSPGQETELAFNAPL